MSQHGDQHVVRRETCVHVCVLYDTCILFDVHQHRSIHNQSVNQSDGWMDAARSPVTHIREGRHKGVPKPYNNLNTRSCIEYTYF